VSTQTASAGNASTIRTDAAAPPRRIGLGIFSVVAGVVGWYAAFELLTERIRELVNPSYVPGCNVNILVQCGKNMESWQGSLFGFTNPILGVAGWMAVILMGVALVAGVRFPRWWWRVYLLGVTLAFVFVVWLISQSLFVLGTLCPWCMVTWAATIPAFWYTLGHVGREGMLGSGERVRAFFSGLYSWAWVIAILCFAIIAFLAQLQLQWIPRAFL